MSFFSTVLSFLVNNLWICLFVLLGISVLGIVVFLVRRYKECKRLKAAHKERLLEEQLALQEVRKQQKDIEIYEWLEHGTEEFELFRVRSLREYGPVKQIPASEYLAGR